MKSLRHFEALTLFALIAASLPVAGPAIAQQTGPAPVAAAPPMPAMPGMTATQPVPPSPAAAAMMSGMAQMNRAMAEAPMTGDPDRDFVAMMLPHHQGAVDMARVELQYGKDPAMLRLAKAILAAQQREIATMRHWQAAHQAP